MASSFRGETVFLALTRPQMFAGVTYGYFVANAILSAEAFLIFKSFWALGIALVVHAVGVACCLREPRFFDLWFTRVSRCPRVKNHAVWGCNSYSP